MENSCIFCKIINNEMGSVKVYEDDLFIAILDKFPTAYGHVLVLPKKHYKDIFEIDEDTISKLIVIAKKICLALQKLGFNDINLLQNNGSLAGQVVNHFHLHIIPRVQDDCLKITFNSQMADDEVLLKIKDDIKKNF